MLKARLDVTEQMDRMMDRLNETRSAGRGCQPVLRMTASGTKRPTVAPAKGLLTEAVLKMRAFETIGAWKTSGSTSNSLGLPRR
jgi:hypothetical protein